LGKRAREFTLASWNVQTFFDGETDGTEYDDFKGSKSSWSRDKYRARLSRLCGAIKIIDADVLVLQEIENEAVVYDIANELNGYMSQNKLYAFACFAKKPGSSIGCAVLSRFAIDSLTAHQTDWRKTAEPIAPDMRPIREVELLVFKDEPPVRLFVNHWKSKSGGEEQAAFWQKHQEQVLARRVMRYAKQASLACGDFNRGIGEWTRAGDDSVEVRDEEGRTAQLASGWLLFSPLETGEGSYFYQDNWETIDHIFASGGASLVSFAALKDGPWVKQTSSGVVPFRYALFNGEGYSDHLPVFAKVQIE
jgi:endonuclease/exonuclease/phosphatase family metal-dependent hydrolase